MLERKMSSMKTDNGYRAKSGVVCSLLEIENNKYRLVLDDVSNSSASTDGVWQHETVVTWKEYENLDLENIDFSEKELSDFGYYVLTRLAAQLNHPYQK